MFLENQFYDFSVNSFAISLFSKHVHIRCASWNEHVYYQVWIDVLCNPLDMKWILLPISHAKKPCHRAYTFLKNDFHVFQIIISARKSCFSQEQSKILQRSLIYWNGNWYLIMNYIKLSGSHHHLNQNWAQYLHCLLERCWMVMKRYINYLIPSLITLFLPEGAFLHVQYADLIEHGYSLKSIFARLNAYSDSSTSSIFQLIEKIG